MNTKKIFSYLFLMGIMVSTVISCKEDSVKAVLNSTVTPNDLLAPSATSYVLTLTNSDLNFEAFKWTKPDFGFNGSISYKLQMDKASGTFTAPVEVAAVNSVLTASITVGSMNDKLLGLGLTPTVAADIKLRVVSSVNDKVSTVISSVKTITVTPYATSFPSIYGMGDGLKGWGPWGGATGNEVEMPSGAYQIYENMALLTSQTGAFRFFKQADWGPDSYNYPFFTTVDANLINANDGDKNFKFTGTTGWYKININLNTKTVSLVAVAEPVLYMVGDGIPAAGWNWNTPVKFTFKKPGVFVSPSTAFNPAGAFRFFAQNDWGPTGYNYPFFTTVDAKFINANDGDKNFKLATAGGPYKLSVDLNKKTVAVVP